jgi:hypothetical protein
MHSREVLSALPLQDLQKTAPKGSLASVQNARCFTMTTLIFMVVSIMVAKVASTF